jgi:hypothetical protein
MKRFLLFVSLSLVCFPLRAQDQRAQQPCCNPYTGPHPKP